MTWMDLLLNHAEKRFTCTSACTSAELGRHLAMGAETGLSMLWNKAPGGFYAFGRALLIRPVCPIKENTLPVDRWNAKSLWKYEYKHMNDGLLCFGEDAFGNQFALLNTSSIALFDGETGELIEQWKSAESWCQAIVNRFNELTGSAVMAQWEGTYGEIPEQMRLMPRTPLVLGGLLAIEELVAVKDADLMRFRGHLATQLRDIPDGSTIQLRVLP